MVVTNMTTRRYHAKKEWLDKEFGGAKILTQDKSLGIYG